ncbi:MAG: TIGR04282 family arsenosugar biosynthesis glycosyltransferase [Acidimicrobiales bacterium]
MAKQPIAGASKTRLLPALTAGEAAELSRCFIVDAVSSMERLAADGADMTVSIAGAPAESAAYFKELAPSAGFVAQKGETLGDRLDHVMSDALASGVAMVLAINSDSPTLPASLVADAFDRLSNEHVDVVLGPAEDGGYYLIGWKRPHPRLVKEVKMSTPDVLRDTMAIAEAEGLRVELTAPWFDVDLPQDLTRVRTALDNGDHCGPATRDFFAARPSLGRSR